MRCIEQFLENGVLLTGLFTPVLQTVQKLLYTRSDYCRRCANLSFDLPLSKSKLQHQNAAESQYPFSDSAVFFFLQ